MIYDDDSGVPDVDVTRMREDFLSIWRKNTCVVALERYDNSEDVKEDSDMFGTKTPRKKKRRLVQLNIQGQQSGAYSRERYGISTAGSVLHVYALFDEDLKSDDTIIIISDIKTEAYSLQKGQKFKISNLNDGIHTGQFAFREFDLVKI